jgi:hypothetical protein
MGINALISKSQKRKKKDIMEVREERGYSFGFSQTRENERTPLSRSEFPLRLAVCVLTRIIFGNS